jgi:hypothetical protein
MYYYSAQDKSSILHTFGKVNTIIEARWDMVATVPLRQPISG